MNQVALEHYYITGDYSLLLEEINNLAYSHPSTKLNDLEKAICVSYHSRALIRLGEVKEAENIIHKTSNINFTKHFSISSLIYQTSIINLQITQGNTSEALREGRNTETLVEQKKHELSKHPKLLSFWSAFLYFLMGMAYYHQVENELANRYFQKSLEVNQMNLFIKAKCIYYMAFLELMKGNYTKFYEFLDESLIIFQSIDAHQGMAWIFTWQGRFSLQKGDLKTAKYKFSQALALFETISDTQGLNLVNSLIGAMFYQQGELKQAEEILEQAFDSSVKIGNPIMLSYCFLPLMLLYLESKNRSKAQKCMQKFQDFSRNSSNKVVKVHLSLAEALFLKSSSRFIDKGQSQKMLLELLKDMSKEELPLFSQILPTTDKDFSFFIIFHLIELYLEEFKLTEDKTIMLEAQQLIENQIQSVHDQKFSPKLVELSLLKAKLLIIDGEIEEALVILEQVKQDANTNNFHRLEEKVGFMITQIEREFQKWDAVISVRDRIEKVQIEEYLKKAQQMISLLH